MNENCHLKRVRQVPVVILLFALVTGGTASAAPAEPASVAANPATIVLNLHLDVPTGARIDYLRIYYYDRDANANSTAWVTTYNDTGQLADLTSVSSAGSAGYGTSLSPYVGHIVDNQAYSYALNWRPYRQGSTMQLCGLRVAYRESDGTTWSTFRYVFAAGSTLLPRSSSVIWGNSPDGGCTFLRYQSYLPNLRK